MPSDASTALLAAAILLGTHYVGAIAGFGSTFLALPLLVWLFGPEQLTVLVILLASVGAAQSVWILVSTRARLQPTFLIPLALGALGGLGLGMALAGRLSPQGIHLALGILLVGAGIGGLRRRVRRRPPPPWPAVAGVGLLAGVVHGAFASGGAVLAGYSQRHLPDRDTFRATLSALWTVLNLVLVPALWIRQPPAGGLFPVLALSMAGVLAASWLGDRTARHVSSARFRAGVALLLLAMGATMLVNTFR